MSTQTNSPLPTPRKPGGASGRIWPLRDALFTALGVALALVLVVRAVSNAAEQRFERQARAELQRVAETAASLVDVEAHAALVADDAGDDEARAALVAPLAALIRVRTGIDSVYTLVLDAGNSRVVLTTKGRQPPDTVVTPDAAREAWAQRCAIVSAVYPTPEGPRISAYAPIVSSTGAVIGLVGVDAPDTFLRDPDGAATRSREYGTLFTIVCTIGAAFAVYTMRSAVRDAIGLHDARLAVLEHKAAEVARAQDHAGAVLATMSHELRTPLTAILGFTELLLDPSDDLAQVRSHAQTIRRNSQHLLGVLNDVLDISKIDAGTMRIDRSPCDPLRVARDVVELLGPRAIEKRIALECTSTGEIPPLVDTDAFRVRQILLNLVMNAVKFTEEGRVTLTVRYDSTDRQLEYAVVDTGIGIEPTEFEHIFKPFHQATEEASRHHAGTGLGLAISQRLAQRMDGVLSVSSQIGSGSTFTLRIPAHASEVRDPVATSAVEQRKEPWTPRPRWHVLVVEDKLEHQKLFYACLRRAGHSVDVCDNGERALHRVREAEYLREPYTVVVMDVYLPGANGLTTARAMREHGFRGPILAVTADTAAEMREKCLAAGCDDVCPKPIERATLLSVLSRLVRAAASAGAA